jgi:hypothetical protein
MEVHTTMSSTKSRVCITAIAAFVLAAASSIAQATVWDAEYDPPAFIGSATFNVANSCLSANGPHVQSDFVGCSIQILSNIATLPAINFAAILPLPLCALCQYEVIGGRFVGVNTGVIGPLAGAPNYWFEFLSTYNSGDVPSVTNRVNLYNNSCEGRCPEPIRQATVVAFTPEPGSLGLLLGALGAGWLVRRRKSAA